MTQGNAALAHERLHVWRPGVALMRRLRFASKLGLLGVAIIGPAMVVTVMFLSGLRASIETTQREADGLQLVQPALVLGNAIHAHARAVQLGGPGSTAEPQAAISRALATVEQAASAQSALQAAELRQAMSRAAQAAGSVAPPGQSAGYPAEHLAASVAIRAFVYDVAERSSLLYEPVAGPYLLMESVVLHSGSVALSVATTGIAAQRYAQSTDELVLSAVRSRAGELAGELAQLRQTLAAAQREGVNAAAWVDRATAAFNAVQALSAAVDAGFANAAAPRDAAALGQSAQAAMTAVANLQEALKSALQTELLARVASQRSEFAWLTAGLLLGLVLLLYLMLCFYRSLMVDLRRLGYAMQQVAEGHLRAVVTVRSNDELGDLAAKVRGMVGGVSSMVAEVGSSAALLAHSGKVLAAGTAELSNRTESQAANLEQTRASLHGLVDNVQNNAHAATGVDQEAVQVRELAEKGAAAMGESVQSVEAIQQSANRMNEIIGTIDSIAFQTNILALNAAVEAARAGEQGRGFAVVASEVRSLAQRSAASAREIRGLIQDSSAQVEGSVQRIRRAGSDIEAIVTGIRRVSESVSGISRSSTEQSSSLQEIMGAVQQLDEITQRNAQMVEMATHQSRAAQRRAETLTSAAAVFELQQGAPHEAVALVERAVQHRSRSGGRDSFLREITDRANGFFDRDMYVFALDRMGKYLAFGGNPAKVGTRVQDVPGIDGNALINGIAAQADAEPGWVEYEITNPATGRVQVKISYVAKVDDVYLGCGVYKSLA
jgi:methyl-accepting chemotaxis protein